MTTVLSDLPRQSDLIVREWDTRHTRGNVDASGFDMSAAANKPEQLLGWCVKSDGSLIVAGEEANAVAVIIDDRRLRYNADSSAITNLDANRMLTIERGPCILKRETLNATDTADAALNVATLVTTLLALGITVLESAAYEEVQGAH